MTHTLFSKISARLMLSLGVVAIAVLVMSTPSSASADVLYRQLEVGMSGSDVGSLQSFLAQDRAIYPQGLVTSYFGFLTKAAVANFQSRNGIAAVGRVGPQTLPVINAQMAAGGVGTNNNYGGDKYAPTISGVNIGTNPSLATVSWTTDEPVRGVVYYSTSPLTVYEQLNSVTIGGSSVQTDTMLRTAQNVTVPGLQSNTVYHYMIHTTDAAGNVSVTWPSTFRTN